MNDVIKEKMIESEYYDFIHEGIRYRKVFYNPIPINKKCICGDVKADIGTRFIAMDYVYQDGYYTKAIVPDDPDYQDIDGYGNPVYVICLVDSESFFTHFIPSDYSDTNPDDQWKMRWDIFQEILSLSSGINKDDAKIISRSNLNWQDRDILLSKFSYIKEYVLNQLDQISEHDLRIAYILKRISFDDSYDITIDRHKLYFLNEEVVYWHILNVVRKLYEEAKEYYDQRRNFEKLQTGKRSNQ